MVLEFINHLWPFILVIVSLVTIHEFGHYFAARACNTRVEAFSIGFGPVLYSKKDKHGTEWRISLIPFGGYIKMLGEYESDMEKTDTYHSESVLSKTPLQRFYISVAGPAANFISAILLCIFVSAFLGISSMTNEIVEVKEGGIAHSFGVEKGDKLYMAELSSSEITSTASETNSNSESLQFNSVEEIIKMINSGLEMTLTLEKRSSNSELTLYEEIKLKKSDSGRRIGIQMGHKVVKVDFIDGVRHGILLPFTMSKSNFNGIYQVITGNASKDSLSGPIKIAQIIKSSANDVYSIIMLLILLSVSLACMNMLPLPGLDGFTALISLIEMIMHKKASIKMIHIMNIAGFICISSITFLVLYNDISQLSFVRNLLK